MIKKIKQILCILSLVTYSICSSNCLAAMPTIQPNGRVYKISGECDAGKSVSVKVFQDGDDISDFNKLVAIGEDADTSDGNYEVSFVMPDRNGRYVAYVKVEGGAVEKVEPSFTYVDSTTRNGFLSSFDGCSDSNSLMGVLSNDADNYINRSCLDQYGVNLEYYDALTDKTDFINICLNEKNGITIDETNISNIIDNTVTVMKINKSTQQDIKNLVSSTDVTYKEINSQNGNVTDVKFDDITSEDKKSYILSNIYANKKYDKLSDYSDQYKKACILYDLNNVRFSNLSLYINEYKNDFKIGEQNGVISYLNNPSTKASENFVKAVEDSPLTEIEQIGTVLATAISTVPQGGSGNGGNTGGGSSGSNKPSNKGNVGSYSISTSIIHNNANAQTETNAVSGDKSVFSDVPSTHWAVKYINALYEKNIIAGKGEGIFDPDASIKREEFIKMLVTAAKIDGVHFVNAFSDVDENAWYSDYVGIANLHKIAVGKDDGTFGIGEQISRQDACVFLYRAAKVTKQSFVNAEAVAELSFEDSEEIMDYAKESIQKLFAAGVVSGVGDNKFIPSRSITRAEAAKILYSVFAEVK